MPALSCTYSTSVGRAGTFCVLSSVLEQLKVEGIVDLFFTIHSLRQCRSSSFIDLVSGMYICFTLMPALSCTYSTSVGRAGTFCVLSSVLEQLKVEGIVDLFFTIHSLRQQQPGLVQTFVSQTVTSKFY